MAGSSRSRKRRVLAIVAAGIALSSSSFTQATEESTWTTQAPAPPPAGPLAYHAISGHVVMFSGSPGETWLYSGLSWQLASVRRQPPGRLDHAMTYDGQRMRIVMFGGRHNNVFLNDTWEWTGDKWIESHPATSPSPRILPALAYDTKRAKVVLFDGSFPTGRELGETWEYDGATWTRRFPAHSPPARAGAGMAYDEARGQMILFGGCCDESGLYGDTWAWDGHDWMQIEAPASPEPRYRPVMTYNPMNGLVVLQGGGSLSGDWEGYADTWAWDGQTWEEIATASSPPAAYGGGIAYSSLMGRIIYVPGQILNCHINLVFVCVLFDPWTWELRLTA